MANDVKLNCYTLQIRDRHLRNQRGEYDLLKEIVFNNGTTVQTSDFSDFFRNFITSFDNKFKGFVGTNHAIYLPPDSISFASERRIVYGFLKGGSTGTAKRIYNKENPDDEVFTLTPDHVNSIEQFFLIWFPEESDLGLIIIQGYSTETSSETFRRLFKKYFSDMVDDKVVELSTYVPRETIDKMREEGEIDKVKLTKHRLPPDDANRILGTTFISSEITIEIKIKGLSPYSEHFRNLSKGNISGLIKEPFLGKPRFFTTPNLEEVGMDGTHEVDFEFQSNGKTTTAKQSKGFKLSPFYYVERDQFPIDPVTNLPTKDSIQTYCLDFFNGIKGEILPNRNS